MGKSRRKTKKIFLIIAVVVLGIALIFGGIMMYSKYQMNKIPGMTFAGDYPSFSIDKTKVIYYIK